MNAWIMLVRSLWDLLDIIFYCHFDGIEDKTNYLECAAKQLFLSDVWETQFNIKLKELDLLQWKPGIVWFVEGQHWVHFIGPGIIHVVHEIWE